MVLFDSLLAFALTLAALATVVTLLMEFAIRTFGLKRKGQVALMKKLLGSDTVKDVLPQAAQQQWPLVKAILENPFSKKPMAETETQQKFPGLQAQGIYREVSLEHVLRRLLESTAAKDLVKETRAELEPKLHAIARKYDEFSSALGADFKRHAQWWSIVVGVGLAVAMNADGTRLLQTYLQDTSLRESVIERLTPQTEGAVPAGGTPEEALAKANRQIALINEMALPLGSGYFPHCYLLQDASERAASPDVHCRTAEAVGRVSVWVSWLLKVLLTGVLIGLGAPFWYDVARRLAAVRSAFNGTPSGEQRHRGADGAGSQDERDDLIERIAGDMASGKGEKAGGAAAGA